MWWIFIERRYLVKTIRTILGGLTAVCRNQFKAVMGMALGLAALTASAQTNPPANDNFANAQVISGLSGSVTNANNTGATLEPGEPSSIITDVHDSGVNVGASIWFAWTATANGTGTAVKRSVEDLHTWRCAVSKVCRGVNRALAAEGESALIFS